MKAGNQEPDQQPEVLLRPTVQKRPQRVDTPSAYRKRQRQHSGRSAKQNRSGVGKAVTCVANLYTLPAIIRQVDIDIRQTVASHADVDLPLLSLRDCLIPEQSKRIRERRGSNYLAGSLVE